MWNAKRFAPGLALAAAVALTAPACAASVYAYQPRYEARRDIGRIAYDNGFRQGMENGERDARRGRRFDIDRDRDFRNADWGYRHEFGPRDEYRRVFRDGYRAGYEQGYRRADDRRDDYRWRR